MDSRPDEQHEVTQPSTSIAVSLNDLKNDELILNCNDSVNMDDDDDGMALKPQLSQVEEENEFDDDEDETEIELNGAACAVSSEVLTRDSSPLQKLLEKQKLELAMELRRLQFANRPVSSTESKTRLEEFFNNSLSSNSDNTSASTSRRNNPEIFRTPDMRNEIENLGGQRRVSSILQSARERLEATLQRYVSTPRPPVVTQPQPRLNQSAAYVNNIQSSSNSINSVQSSANNANVFTPVVAAWVPVVTANTQDNLRTVTPVVLNNQPWLLAAPQQPGAVNFEQIRREQIIDEISELVHQQLVSSTLESQFRQQLEHNIMSHLQNNGNSIDAQRTRDFLRTIRPTNAIERNDFSHLGINAPRAGAVGVDDNLDSASTYQEPSRNNNSNRREIKSLQAEVKELKNMMKLSFELQLDMQRSLRQEIAALIAGTLLNTSNQQPTLSSRSGYNRNNQVANEGSCVICTDGQVDTVFYKCGHMSTCFVCAMTLKQQGRPCPVCRAPITDILRTYKCNLE